MLLNQRGSITTSDRDVTLFSTSKNVLSQLFDEVLIHCFILGHEADYLNLAVRDGGVSLTMGLGNGKQEMHIKPTKTRFDDHQWHKLTVHRRIQEVIYFIQLVE